MTEWIDELRSALKREFADAPAFCTLATLDKSSTPRARTVVCRRVTDDGAVLIASDARSEKNEQLKLSAAAEVVFWLPTNREQYRVQGATRILSGETTETFRLEIWRQLSDAARALFTWPSPGARRIDPPEKFAKSVGADVPPPANFEIIVVRPRRVEHLNLNEHPHRRRRWMLAGKWGAASELNP